MNDRDYAYRWLERPTFHNSMALAACNKINNPEVGIRHLFKYQCSYLPRD